MRSRWLALVALGVRLAMADAPPAWGLALDGNPITGAQLAAAQRATGLAPALVVFFQQWPEDPATGTFPGRSVDAITAAGARPVITWEPMFYRAADGAETMIAADVITRGGYDSYLERFARAAADWRRPLVLRFAHEMNLGRYHWGGPPEAYGAESPARYRAMWRHVVGVFRRCGATNVTWAFCPNCESVPGAGDSTAPWNTVAAYYPGTDVVDVVGLDGYNWGDTQTPERNGWRSQWRSFADIFATGRETLTRLAPGKPVYVFETACAPTGGDKGAWLRDMSDTAVTWRLAGVVWFEVRKEVDWRLQTAVPAGATDAITHAFGPGTPR